MYRRPATLGHALAVQRPPVPTCGWGPATASRTHDVDEALPLGDHLGLLTHRPSRLHRTIAVPFGPDRNRATLTEPGFVLLKREVLDVVLSA